jgi:hypothetical protein
MVVEKVKKAPSKKSAVGEEDIKQTKNAKMREDKHKPPTKAEMKEKKAAKKAKASEHLKNLWGA